VVEHRDLFDQPQRVVQGQNVDARSEAQSLGALGGGRQEDVLRRRHGVDRRRVVFGQVVGEEAGLVQGLHLYEPLLVEPVQRHAGQVLDVVEDPEPDARHLNPSRLRATLMLGRRRGPPSP
jgi:hypothetical protein